jgi:hypothetical protein
VHPPRRGRATTTDAIARSSLAPTTARRQSTAEDPATTVVAWASPDGSSDSGEGEGTMGEGERGRRRGSPPCRLGLGDAGQGGGAS